MAEAPDIYALLDQSGWVHALARNLVHDPHAADDLVQDTWLQALQVRPDTDRPLRGWLATVVRNRVAKLRRGDASRAQREALVSREEATLSALDVVEKAATHRDLVEAVLQLDEPYRRTILLRFFEQLSYREIAKRMDVTSATVNSRITRGLERLRRRLDASYGGDRRACLMALAPLAEPGSGLAPIGTGTPTAIATIGNLGVNFMNTAIGVVAVSIVAVTAVSFFDPEGEPGSPTTLVAPAAGSGLGERPELADPGPAPRPEEKVAATTARTRTTLAAEPSASPQAAADWETRLSHGMRLDAAVRTVVLNAGAGSIELLPGPDGDVSIEAHVRANTKHVKSDRLTNRFEDHVEVITEESTLRIEDAHDNEDGWSVSFKVYVPRGLEVRANSGAGDVEVRTGSGNVMANSGAGVVRLVVTNEALESVNLNSGAGRVEADVLAVAGQLNANSGAGEVTVRVRSWSSGGTTTLNSGVGEVRLVVPSNVIGKFELESGLGVVEVPSSLGLEIEGADDGMGMKAHGTVGQGGGRYSLNTGVGKAILELEEDGADPF